MDNKVGAYIPTSVQPTLGYPYSTDRQFINRKVSDPPYADMKKNVPGMHAVPTMDLEGGAEGTGVFEIDGKFHVLPTQVNGEKFKGNAAVERFRKTGEHLGIFNAEDDASIFEQQYLGDIGKNNKPSLLQSAQSKDTNVGVSSDKKTSNGDALSAALKGSQWVTPGQKVTDPEAFLQEQDHSNTPLTPNDLEIRRRVQDTINERNRKEKMNENDPLTEALKRTFPTSPSSGSYFPAAQQMFAGNDRTDLLKDIDNTFYGGGQAQPSATPTPTPSAVKPHQMNLAQLYDHFGVDQPTPQSYFPAANKQMQDFQSQYGWSPA